MFLAGFGFWLVVRFWVGCCVRLAGFVLCLLVCWVIWVCCCCSLLVLGGLGGGCFWFGFVVFACCGWGFLSGFLVLVWALVAGFGLFCVV